MSRLGAVRDEDSFMTKEPCCRSGFVWTALGMRALLAALALPVALPSLQAQAESQASAEQRPIPFVSGEDLTGTAGTATGVRRVVAEEKTETGFDRWWNGPTLLSGAENPFFDLREKAAKNGVKFTGSYQGAFFGVIASEGGSRGFWSQQINFGSEINVGKLLAVEALEGMVVFGAFRYREPEISSNPNTFVDAPGSFNPSSWYSGTQFRVVSFGVEIRTADFLPLKDMFVLRGGWLQPQREFLEQPLSKLFLNTAINSSRGLGGNIPFSSSFSSWGATLKLNAAGEYYLKGGLFMAFPQGTASTNHGLAFAGYALDPGLNGLFAIAETGCTPTLGLQELPGRYAFGGYYWGLENTSYSGTETPGQYGFYFQADQMVFREPAPPSESRIAIPDAKTFSAPVTAEKPKFSEQGLHTFNMLTFAPGYNNTFPFYFQAGLAYAGIVPGRDKDFLMAAIAYGAYQQLGGPDPRTYTAVLEGGYRFQVNGWSFLQPFVQYLVRPAGTNDVRNATILGFTAGLVF